MSFEFGGAFSPGTSGRSKMFVSETGKYPGPGNYPMPNFHDKMRSTDTLFPKNKREIDYSNGIPGPGTYKPTFNHLDKQLPVKFVKPHQNQPKPPTIGPGSYDPKLAIESKKRKPPTFSFGFRPEKEPIPAFPAPNAYFEEGVPTIFKTVQIIDEEKQPSVQSNMRRTHSSSMISRVSSRNGFGSSERMKFHSTGFPGPGEYRSQLQTPSNQGSVFGRSQRNWLNITDNPGPGSFDPKTPRSQKQPGYSLGQKLHDSIKTYETFVPGPGTYDGQLPSSKQNVRFGMEQKHNLVDKESMKKPGPNYYYPLPNVKKLEIDIPTIGYGDRPPLSKTVEVPGPGEYKPKESVGEGPKWKMAAKLPKKNKIDFPGPGAYDMDATEFLYQKPRFSTTVGSRSNQVSSQFQNTGPGSYDISTKINTNKFGSTQTERFNSKKGFFEPGPGSYDVGGTIGKIPGYLLLAKKKHSQLLDFQN